METFSARKEKNYAALSYITLIGWLIAYIANKENNNSFINFHLRQALGLHLILVGVSCFQNFITLGFNIKNIALLFSTLFLIIGAIHAIQRKEKSTPLLGNYFQDWFKSI